MINRKITALITSIAMMMSTGAAAMTGFTAVAADKTTTASTEAEHKHCEMCGAELPDDALPSPLGIYVCSDCRQSGAGGTRPRTDVTVTQTTTATTTTSMPRTDNDVLPTDENPFYFEIMCKETNDLIFDSYFNVKIEYEDGTSDTFEYTGAGVWIARKNMKGTVSIISTVNKYKISPDVLFVPFPDSGSRLTLYIEKNPDYEAPKKTCIQCGKELPDDALTTALGVYVCDDCRGMGIGGTTTGSRTTATTYVTNSTTTVPIAGKELAIALYGRNSDIVGGAKLKITYDDGTDEVIETRKGAPTIVKANGRGGTVKILDLPSGYELKYISSDRKDFAEGAQFVTFDLKDVSYKMGYIVPNKEYFVVKPGEEAEIGFKTKGVEVLGVECGIDEIKVKEWFMTSAFPDNDATAIITVPADMETSYDWCYSLRVTYRVYNEEEEFVYDIPIYVADDSTPTTSSTTTTTTTTTVVYTSTTTVVMDYATKAEYDPSPMKIGEIRPVVFYNAGTKLSAGADIDCTSPNATLTCDGNNILYVYATAAGEIEIYIRENTCAFGTYVNLTVLDEEFTGTNTTTATATTTETTTFDTSTTTTTTSRLPGQGVDLLDFESVVIAIDDTAIQFESLNTYPLTNYSASQFEHVKPGDKVHVRFLSDTYEHGMVMNAFVVEVLDENCPVEATEKGDANCDGELNMADAVLIMQAASNPDKYGIGLTTGINLIGAANGDVDGSGDITNMDALKIQQYKLGIIKKL